VHHSSCQAWARRSVLADPDHPWIRLAIGDLTTALSGRSPCGRTNLRIKGWMGRADQTTKIKGMFVRPEQVAEIAKRHPELGRLRLVVQRDNEQLARVMRVGRRPLLEGAIYCRVHYP
jgi:phenylacetate-CoA ligase